MKQITNKLRLPNFIIVGAMKSATSTLQEQLAMQPGIFTCDPKEPNYFSDDDQYCKGLRWYSELFSAAPENALLGEASTHYTKLPTHPHSVARMHALLPNARLVYVMRHPIDRLVSHYIHEWSMGTLSCGINDAVRRHSEMIAYGLYAMQLSPIFEVYGREAVLPVFFDRLIREPQAELERVCRFIGYCDTPQWSRDLKPSNVSSERIRRFPFYRLLIESTFATGLRRRLIPQSWRNSVKTKLRITQRPVLSTETILAIETEFDHDLSRLGQWLGESICCRNFKDVTGAKELNWMAGHG